VLRMAEIARAHGACANSAGSGGAIVGALGEADAWPALAAALRAERCEAVGVGCAKLGSRKTGA